MLLLQGGAADAGSDAWEQVQLPAAVTPEFLLGLGIEEKFEAVQVGGLAGRGQRDVRCFWLLRVILCSTGGFVRLVRWVVL